MNDLDIAYKLNNEIVTFWQFYVAGFSAVIGWILSRDNQWSESKRLAVLIGVCLFIIFNVSGLYRTTSAMHDIVSVLMLASYQIPTEISPEVFASIIDRLDTGDWHLHIGAHAVADAILLYFIWVVAGRRPDKKSDG